MARFSGKLSLAGQVILPIVSGDVHSITLPNGLQQVSGQFTLPPGVYVHAGSGYELTLDTGQGWRILVLKVSTGSHQATVVHFQVQGPFP
jgi:hypothetical protein